MWTPEAFVLYGKLCDDKTLSDQLDVVRTAAQAEAVILLVSRGDEFIDSMIRVSHWNPGFALKLQTDLILGCQAQAASRAFPAQSRHISLSDSAGLFPKPAVHACLSASYTGATKLVLIPATVNTASKHALHPWAEAPLSSYLLVVVNPPFEDEQVRTSVILAREPLLCMINLSQTVRSSRWNYAMKEVDRRLDRRERDWMAELERIAAGSPDPSRNDFEHLIRFSADLLLEEATDLTDSSSGQVFITQTDKRQLAVYAYRRYSCGGEGGVIQLDNPDGKGLVLRAFNLIQAALINDIPAYVHTHPPLQYVTPTGAPAPSQAELLVPITQNTAGDEHVVFGVLNLENEAGHYTMRDLDVCQHLTRRYCRWWARIQHTIFARSLTRLTRRVAHPLPFPKGPHAWELGAAQPTAGHVHWIDDFRYDDRVPSEFWQAVPRIRAALKTAFELTRSHMARVFLVTAGGDTLVPYCDYPVRDLREYEAVAPARFETRTPDLGPGYEIGFDVDGRELRFLEIRREWHDRSISAWVAEHGRACFVGNFDEPDALAGHDGLRSYFRTYGETRSECCVPLYLTGRLIGTLNFQSVYINVYREQRHLIEAIAELIGLTFAHERRAVEQEVVESHAVLAGRRHRLIHAMRDLRNLADSFAPQVPPEFLKILERTNELVVNIERKSDAPPAGGAEGVRATDRAVGDLIQSQVARLKGRAVWQRAAGGHDVVAEDSVAPFAHALYEVLHNAQIASWGAAGGIEAAREDMLDSGLDEERHPLAFGKLIIDCEKRRLGGDAYSTIRVRNRCGDVGAASFQHELYRQPYQASPNDRPHLGAFIAGSMLRSVGGEMSFAIEPVPAAWGEGYIATTRLDVKLTPRTDRG